MQAGPLVVLEGRRAVSGGATARRAASSVGDAPRAGHRARRTRTGTSMLQPAVAWAPSRAMHPTRPCMRKSASGRVNVLH